MATVTHIPLLLVSACYVTMVMAHDPVADALHQLQQQVIGLDRQNKNITAKLNSLSDTVEQLQNQLTSRLGR